MGANAMKSAFLLASPQVRARLRRARHRKSLRRWGRVVESSSDLGFLQLAKLVLTGRDTRPLPSEERVRGVDLPA